MNINELFQRAAINEGADALRCTVKALESALEEIARVQRDYDAAADNARRAALLNRAVQYCASNILGNARLDLLATAQTKLTTIARQRAAK